MNHTLRAAAALPSDPPSVIADASLCDYTGYLRDESRLTGRACGLAFPRTAAEVSALLRLAAARGVAVTVSGARTGITAGAVPDGGLLLCLDRMNRITGLQRSADGHFRVSCQPGVILADLQRAVRLGRFPESRSWSTDSLAALEEMRHHRLLYPPDPTETSASVGGTVACNASGAHTFRHGPTRRYVHALEVVLADGSLLHLRRGETQADDDGGFALVRADGTRVTGRVPRCRQPQTKNAAGYFTGPGGDLIDLFIGSEATLGVITDVELELIPLPEVTCAVVTFWEDDGQAVALTLAARQQRRHLGLEAMEYFDPRALQLLRQRRSEVGAASGVPECIPANAASAIYLDLGCSAHHLPTALADLAALVRHCGGNPDLCWTGMDKDERERLRRFRHALPETVNLRIGQLRQQHPGITKLGTDMAVPDEHLEHILAFYRAGLARHGLEHVIFGHIGDNHLHVNILPRNPQEYAVGKALYAEFAREVVRLGGSPAAEHGVGRLKTGFLRLLYGDAGVAEMRALKAVFDPDGRLAPGVWFDADAVVATRK